MRDKYSFQSKLEYHTSNSSEPHGMTDWVPCEFYLDPQGREIEENGGVPTLDNRLIKVLFYEGEIKKIFCPFLQSGGTCSRALNTLPGKRCYFIDA